MTDPKDSSDTFAPVPLPEQPPMDDAAGGPQADDTDADGNGAAPHTPVTD